MRAAVRDRLAIVAGGESVRADFFLYRTYKYRLYPNRKQTELLEYQLSEARRLYNAALEERREAWKRSGTSISLYDQQRQLKEIRSDGNLGLPNFHAAAEVLARADRAFSVFFRRVKLGQTPGYPRFKSKKRFNSYTFPDYGNGFSVTGDKKLRVQGIGNIKVKFHRPLVGSIKTLTLKRVLGKWYACLSVFIEGRSKPPCSKANAVGIDLGIYSFIALSNGEVVENPRNLKNGLKRLRRLQRNLSRKKKGGSNRRKAARLVAGFHEKVKNRRADFQHKLSRKMADTFGLVVVEDLSIKGLSRGTLSQSVHDAAWGSFLDKLSYKVEETGGGVVKVNPKHTSQICSGCGSLPLERKLLSQRTHKCAECGIELDRDVNAARNILRLGSSLWDITWEVAPSVSQEAVATTE